MITVPKDDSRISHPSETRDENDGTLQLLRWGASTLAAGIIFATLTKTVFGGIGFQGPNSSAGWLSLIVTMMCLPFGTMLFLLGAAKWFRKRRGDK